MDKFTDDTFESVYIFVSSIVVNDEERIIDSTWGVRMTISDIHTLLFKEMCCERYAFAFVVPFDSSKVRLGQWEVTLGNDLDTGATFVYGGIIAQVTEPNVSVDIKVSEKAKCWRTRDWVVFGTGVLRSKGLEQLRWGGEGGSVRD
jgi:hypothetical protein